VVFIRCYDLCAIEGDLEFHLQAGLNLDNSTNLIITSLFSLIKCSISCFGIVKHEVLELVTRKNYLDSSNITSFLTGKIIHRQYLAEQ
jgi:hypothetical protein